MPHYATCHGPALLFEGKRQNGSGGGCCSDDECSVRRIRAVWYVLRATVMLTTMTIMMMMMRMMTMPVVAIAIAVAVVAAATASQRLGSKN